MYNFANRNILVLEIKVLISTLYTCLNNTTNSTRNQYEETTSINFYNYNLIFSRCENRIFSDSLRRDRDKTCPFLWNTGYIGD